MERSDFFNVLFKDTFQKRKDVNASLNAYANPLTELDVMHLLRRCTFGLNKSVINSLVGKSADEAVETLINNANNKKNPPAPSWANDTFVQGGDNAAKFHLHNSFLAEWWYDLMRNDNDSILEKMVLFWHGHFTTQYNICDTIPGQLMYRQNQLFRNSFVGNFRQFLVDITLDGAMMLYLNNNLNIAELPNENYARELMELFSIGIGNYTENDVREVARALTGWKINYFNNNGQPTYAAYINTNHFDSKNKVIFGENMGFSQAVNQENIKKYSIEALIDLILTKKGDKVSDFIVRKLYRLFVYSNPNEADQNVISQLATIFKNSNWDIRPVISTLLKSEHFFDAKNRGIQPKSPAEVITGISKEFRKDVKNETALMTAMGLKLLSPPNVAGWKGYHQWLSSKNIPFAVSEIEKIIKERSDGDLLGWAQKFANVNSKVDFTKELSSYFLARPLSEKRLTAYSEILGDWSSKQDGAKLRALLLEIIKAPDFYLF